MADSKRSYIMHIKRYLIDLMEMRGDTVHSFLLEKCEKNLFSKMIEVSKNKAKAKSSCKSRLCFKANPDLEINESVT